MQFEDWPARQKGGGLSQVEAAEALGGAADRVAYGVGFLADRGFGFAL